MRLGMEMQLSSSQANHCDTSYLIKSENIKRFFVNDQNERYAVLLNYMHY